MQTNAVAIDPMVENMKKRKERNIDPSVYEDDSSDQDFNCAVIGGALKSLRRSHGKRQQEIAAILKRKLDIKVSYVIDVV